MKKAIYFIVFMIYSVSYSGTLQKELNLSEYVTKVRISDSVQVSLYTSSMFRVRISHLPGENKFPEKYEIPFVIGKLENWARVDYSIIRKENITEIRTDKLIIVTDDFNCGFKVFTKDNKIIYPSEGQVYGMFRDGYTLFDNASAFGQENNNSRFSHWFYSPLTKDYKSVFLKDDLIEDLYFIYGPDYPTLFKQFNELTGPEPLLPIKAYGFFQTQHLACNGSQEKLMKVAKKFREKDIPCDNLIIDFEWGDGCMGKKEIKWGNLDWSSNYLKPLSPNQMLDSLHAMHFNVMLIHHSAPDFPGRFGQGWTEQVYPWDTWWSKLKRKLNAGVDGVWQDTRRNGITDAEIWQGLKKYSKGKRPLFMGCRKMQAVNPWDPYFCAFPLNSIIGSRRYPFVWTGDCSYSWMELAWQIKAITNTFGSMQGISYISSDGFAANWKIQARWNQFTALSAVARSHHPKPWTSDFNTEGFIEKIRITGRDTIQNNNVSDEKSETIPLLEQSIRKHLKLRYRLLPYIYSTAFENYKTGIPICRPMLLAFPKDYKCSGDQWPYQYMLGKYLLIAPVYGDFNTMEIYLPEGDVWTDFWDGERYKGGQILRYDTRDITKLPIFIKGGAIIPKISDRNWIEPDLTEKQYIIDVYPDKHSEFLMYFDDGKTDKYKSGEYSTILLECLKSGKEIKFIINDKQGEFKGLQSSLLFNLNFKDVDRPESVEINNKNISIGSDRRGNYKCIYNQKKRSLQIKMLAKVVDSSVILIRFNKQSD